MIDQDEARQLLEERRQEVRRVDAGRAHDPPQQTTGELADFDQHSGDYGTETFEFEKEQSISQRVKGQLQDIERAFQRLEAGEWGTCEICGREIDEERLRLRPEARWCKEHREEMEGPDRAPEVSEDEAGPIQPDQG